MKKNILHIVIILLLTACSNIKQEQSQDQLVNEKILESVNMHDNELWAKIEFEFFRMLNCLAKIENNDTVSALHKLNIRILSEGYLPEFFLDTTTQKGKDFVSKLNDTGLTGTEKSIQRFLFKVCEPLNSDYDKQTQSDSTSANIIEFYGSNNPDSISMSFDLNILGLEKENSTILEDFWNQDGSRKILILMYVNRMIKKKKHYPQQRL